MKHECKDGHYFIDDKKVTEKEWHESLTAEMAKRGQDINGNPLTTIHTVVVGEAGETGESGR